MDVMKKIAELPKAEIDANNVIVVDERLKELRNLVFMLSINKKTKKKEVHSR